MLSLSVSGNPAESAHRRRFLGERLVSLSTDYGHKVASCRAGVGEGVCAGPILT